MKSKYKRINFIIIIAYIIGMIYTTSQLFGLQDELILGVSLLTTDNISSLSVVLSPIYITVTITLVAGLIAILLNYKNDQSTAGFQYTSHTDNADDNKTEGSIEQQKSSSQTNLDFSSIQNVLKTNSDKKDKYTAVLTAICKKIEAGQGAIYLVKDKKEVRVAELYTSYAFHISETQTLSFAFGEGLIGQVAVEGNTLVIDDVPENYITIVSGLGNASPKHLLITPLIKNEKIVGIIELASFTPFSKEEVEWIKESLTLLVSTAAKKAAPDSISKKDKAQKNKNE